MAINDQLTQCSNLAQLHLFVDSLVAGMGTFGGRRYFKKTDKVMLESVCLNDIVKQFDYLANNLTSHTITQYNYAEELEEVKHASDICIKVDELDKDGNLLVKNSNLIYQILTFFKRLFGNIYINRPKIKQNINQSIENFREVCQDFNDKENKIKAVKNLYDEGYKAAYNAKPDYRAAIQFFSLAHEKGHEDAFKDLQWMYVRCNADNVIIDPRLRKQAVEWFHQKANENDTDAIGKLSIMYKEGWGVPQNQAKSDQLMQKYEVESTKKGDQLVKDFQDAIAFSV